MEDLARNLDAMQLAQRLQRIEKEDVWLHVEAEGPLEKYPGKSPNSEVARLELMLMRHSETTCAAGARLLE